ncbi:MAG: methionine--tRNA ligase [Chitinophagales bacterium]|nr:methionine--tRNA ligase [Chitinophagales bacterium]
MKKRYTITAALPYANGPLHIGHLAGAYIAADIYARFLRLQNHDVCFVSGSDEHGAAITIKAMRENTTPQAIVDKYHHIIKKSFEDFGIEFDIYHRTTAPIHYDTSQEFFLELLDKNAFEVIESEQYYDETAHQFLADRYIIGTCPNCGNENAYGDQCEKCGSSLSPTELIRPKSTISGDTPILKKTKHWYLKLNEQEAWLKQWLNNEDKKDWKAHVLGQCNAWLDNGLQPRAMTRDLDWGIPVPLEDAKNKVLYVWLDAPIGYISATKDWANANGKDWKDYWQNDKTELVHFIGKDNIVFHCIIFPSILHTTDNYIVPTNVPANAFMNLEGNKISTSKNWAVWLHEYLEEFPNKQDELRYVLIANMPENKDSEFTWQDFQDKVNNELVATYGNFVNRIISLINKYYDGNIDYQLQKSMAENDSILKTTIDATLKNIENYILKFKFKDALNELMSFAREGNKFLAETEPWKLYTKNPDKTKDILSIGLDWVYALGVLSQPLLPFTAKKIFALLNTEIPNNLDCYHYTIKNNKINKATLLFEKIEDSQIEFQIEKLKNTLATTEINTVAPPKENIAYEDFDKLDIRTGKIVSAKKVEKADKLLELLVDVGFEQRTIVSGIAEHFSADEIVGQEVAVLVNLAPKKLRGIMSNGMILMAEDENGKLVFVNAKNISSGNIIR